LKLDISGKRFGKLTAIHWDGYQNGNSRWLCRCDCGNEKTILLSNLKQGETKSCGCWRRQFRVTHNASTSRAYRIWTLMKIRCSRRTTDKRAWKYYIRRGISVCRRWRRFENFLADMGQPPAGLTLDRIDNNKGYSPANCRWATRTEQNNNSRFNRILSYRGKRLTVAQWARELHISAEVVRSRLRYGWTAREALEGR